MEIKIADAIMYGRLKEYKPRSIMIKDLIVGMLPKAREILDFSDDFDIAIRCIRKKRFITLDGVYSDARKVLEITPRIDTLNSVIQTLAHELVHAEQFKQGRLKSDYADVYKEEPIWVWEDKLQVSPDTIKDYEAYRKLPWEVEAYDRQDKIAEELFYSYQSAGGDSMAKLVDKYASI
jgi:hypothetical protein